MKMLLAKYDQLKQNYRRQMNIEPVIKIITNCII